MQIYSNSLVIDRYIQILFCLILVKPDTLLDMVEYMTEKVGLVHQMPFTCDREGFAATFEKVRKHIC